MPKSEDRLSRPRIRWWPAILILVVVGGILASIWLRDAAHTQAKVIPSLATLILGAMALFLWLVLASRLAGRLRLRIFLAGVLLIAAGSMLFEIKGVSGNLVPVIGYRWSADDSFSSLGSKAAGVTAPGPNDYPQFYGPRRNATLEGPQLARDWKAQPPREVWRREIGEGWAGFAVVGNAAITQEQRGQEEAVVRYDLATGEPVWVHVDATHFDTTIGGNGPRSTPAIADGRVYSLGSTGLLNCLDLNDGSQIWQRDVLEDNASRMPEWGMSSSPLIVGNLVVVQLGAGGVSLTAYDRASGEPAWKGGTDNGSYSSPTLLTVAGREQIVIANQRSVAGHDPASGEQLWSEPWTLPGEKISLPLVVGDDRLLVSAAYGIGSRMLRLTPADSGFEVEEIWETRRLKSKFAPMVARQGVVYGLDDGVMVAIDPATGERRWKRGRYGHGQFIMVDDLLLLQTEKGDVVLVEAHPDEHRELSRLPALSGKTWNPPALAGRMLLVRNNREAACYELPVAG